MTKSQKEPRSTSRLFVAILALLAGGFGGLLANWRVLGSSLGLFPELDVPFVREVRREAFIEESASIAAVERARRSIVTVLIPTSGEARNIRDGLYPVGTGVALTDDGLLYLVIDGASDLTGATVRTRDGYSLPFTVIGSDPWGGGTLARIDLQTIPALEIEAAQLASDAPQLGQHVITLTGGWAPTVWTGTFAHADGSMFPPARPSTVETGQLVEAWRIEPGAPPAPYFDLRGNLLGVGIGAADGAISAPSLQALLTHIQTTGRVERPSFDFEAAMRTFQSGGLFAALGAAAEVTDITEASAAVRAGLQIADRITAVNGRALSTEYQLLDALVRQRHGVPVALTVQRGTEKLELSLTP